jgi:hypothetical protein
MERNTQIAAAFAVLSTCGQLAMGILEIHHQVLGLSFAAIAVVSMAYLLWHGMNWLRSYFGMREIKLEPIHVIVFGLLIAAAGVGWQWARPSTAPSPAVGTTTATPIPPTAANLPRPNPATELIAGPYERIDIAKLIPILASIDDLLNKEGIPISRKLSLLLGAGGLSEASITELKLIDDRVTDLAKAIENIMSENSRYRGEITPAITNVIGAFQTLHANIAEAQKVLDDLKTAEGRYQRTTTIARNHLIVAAGEYDQAVNTSMQNVQTKIRRCRDYKPAP